MTREKCVDESWKESVASEKEQGVKNEEQTQASGGKEASIGVDQANNPAAQQEATADPDEGEINFVNYVASLAFQAMIFLGEIPNPMAENKIEKNLKQAKFLIDTLILIQEKTKGNLTKQEEDLLNGSVYELQMKYVASQPQEEVQ